MRLLHGVYPDENQGSQRQGGKDETATGFHPSQRQKEKSLRTLSVTKRSHREPRTYSPISNRCGAWRSHVFPSPFHLPQRGEGIFAGRGSKYYFFIYLGNFTTIVSGGTQLIVEPTNCSTKNLKGIKVRPPLITGTTFRLLGSIITNFPFTIAI